jgi:hypothetical protein
MNVFDKVEIIKLYVWKNDNHIKVFGTTPLKTIMNWGSSVSIVSDYGLDGQGLILNRGRGFFF